MLTGLLSPVIKDSSVCVFPFLIVPSTAIFSPGLLTTISPFSISFIFTSISLLSFKIVPFLGVIVTKFLIVSTAFCL